jgi:signal transduction histidine kinase
MIYQTLLSTTPSKMKSRFTLFTITFLLLMINSEREISAADNGNGIPEKIKEKIFQPFFTTKPTGQGTGLGLSLSYDIVKAHGGEIKVNTNEGDFTEFTIELPI